MKVLNASQIRAADQHTIENEPISSIDLMERASEAFVAKFLELFPNKREVQIFCGTGNNGGDGLAIGRMLHSKGWDVSIFVLGESGSPDFETNLQKSGEYVLLDSPSDFPQLTDQIVIDGLFGSGLSRPIEGIAAKLIKYLNQEKVVRISVDISSGLFADQSIQKESLVFRADHTISFQAPKLVFFLPEYDKFNGEWHVVDIGLDQDFIASLDSTYFYTERETLESLIPKLSRFSHKSQVGKLLVVAGSRGKMGAAALCTKAALRAGVGLINVHVPKCGVDIMQMLVPEAMVIEDVNEEVVSAVAKVSETVAIGPGLGTAEITKSALEKFLNDVDQPIVLDADALNIVATNSKLLQDVPNESILTPHPGEFRRLVGEWNDDFEKLELLTSFCKHNKLNVVLKGAYSAVCNSSGEIYFNPSGNPGMATAGSGDVLTGIIASFLAQGLSPFNALSLGVYIHGVAGDFAAAAFGQNSMIASDIISNISNALMRKGV